MNLALLGTLSTIDDKKAKATAPWQADQGPVGEGEGGICFVLLGVGRHGLHATTQADLTLYDDQCSQTD